MFSALNPGIIIKAKLKDIFLASLWLILILDIILRVFISWKKSLAYWFKVFCISEYYMELMIEYINLCSVLNIDVKFLKIRLTKSKDKMLVVPSHMVVTCASQYILGIWVGSK